MKNYFSLLLFVLFSYPAFAGIEIRGGGVLIPDGDTTPSTADGTDFGEVNVPQTRTRTFTAKAVGLTETVIVTENGTAWSIASGGGPVAIGAGSTHTFTVRLEPTAAGYKTATVVIAATSGNYSFTVEGNAIGEPEIAVSGRSDSNLSYINITDGDTSPSGVDGTNFGSQDVAGGALSHTFKIENSGTERLTIDSITEDSSQFSIAGVPSSVSVNGSSTFTVKFNPSSTGTKTATVTIQNDDPDGGEGTFTFEVTGSGEAPEIEVLGGDSQTVSISNPDTSPRTLDNTDFGTVVAGSSPLTKVFKIKNNGNHPLTVFSVTEDTAAFSITGAPGPFDPIAPGGSDNFNIILDTSTAGTKSGTVTIESDDPDNGIFTFDVTAEATGDPEIAVGGRLNELAAYVDIDDPDTTPSPTDGTDFGSNGVDDGFTEHTFRIQNSGNAKLNIDSITEDSSAFTIVDAPSSVAVDGEKTFGVRFNPSASGQKTATVTIENDDPDGGEALFTFDVTGLGLYPKIQVYGGVNFGEFIGDEDDTPRTADYTDFGAVAAGSGTLTSPFRIRNDGNQNLTVISILEDGPAFSIPSPPALPATIAPGGSLDFSVEFAPTAAGSKAATVTIVNNDTVQERDAYTFDIVGEATGDALLEVAGRESATFPYQVIANGAQTTTSGDGTAFGDVQVASGSETRTFRITNSGTAQLSIDSITESSDHFSVSDIPGVVGIGQSKTFDVTFDPDNFGTKRTTIRIATNASGEESFTFRVSGTGRAPKIEAQAGVDGIWGGIPNGAPIPDPSDGVAGGQSFETRDIGSSLIRGFAIYNAGNEDLILTGITEGGAGWSIVADPFPSVVPPGEHYNYGIDFDPFIEGIHSTTISIFSSDPDIPVYTFGVAGLGVGDPDIAVFGSPPGNPIPILVPDNSTVTTTGNGTDFGDRDVTAGGISHTFEIFNDGNGVLNISSFSEGSPHFSISGAPSEVGAGQTEMFTITFNPTSFGEKTATINIISDVDPPLSFYNFDVSGIGEAPDIEVAGGTGFSEEILNGDFSPSPDEGTDFGSVNTDSNVVTSMFRITNSGNESLVILGTSTDHPDVTFTDVPSPGNPIAPGDWDEFTLAFDPSAAGFVTANVLIESNDPDEDPFTFEVEGRGIDDQPEIAVRGKNSRHILLGDVTPSLAEGTAFGSVDINGVTESRVFTIDNNGTGPLDIFSVTEDGARFDIQGTPSGSILPDESVDLTVLFNPDTETVHDATVTIANNDANEGTFTFAVRGTGVSTPPPAEPDIAVQGGQGLLKIAISNGDDTPRRFDGTDAGNIVVGESATRTFRIENTGDAALTISEVALMGVPSAVASYPSSIPAGGSANFDVILAPPSAGAFTSTLGILSNDPDDSPFEFTVAATGVDPVNMLQITGVAVQGQNLILTFVSDPLKTYRIAWSTEITADPASWNRPAPVSGLLGDVNEQPYLLPGVADETRPEVFLRVEEE